MTEIKSYLLAVALVSIVQLLMPQIPGVNGKLKGVRYYGNKLDWSEESDNLIDTIDNQIGSDIGFSDVEVIASHNPDEDLSTPELVRKYGYPAETHEVTTQDGFILTLHRIPHGRNDNSSDKKRPPILLHHGLFCSSADWIMNTVDKALGYQLADLGYDVWLANSRGNVYSRKHVSLTPDQPQFWDFSFHEIGYYDLPAYIDYILTNTGEPELFYIGHSMGTIAFWILMSEHPEYNSKIHSMFAMGPVAFLNGTVSPIHYLADISTELRAAEALFGDREFLPQNGVVSKLHKTVCEEKFLKSLICENILFLMCGFDRAQLNETMLPVIVAHTPAGTSSHTVIHFLQLMKSGKFRQFDFGKRHNKKRYGSEQPPEYDLKKVTTKVALFYGQNDWLAVPKDVLELSKALPNVVVTYKVKLEAFNHLDFLYAVDINKLLYNDLLKLLKEI
ncbi:unnamed protein product [Orchesella dallaii]|uniref:Partial AB-hydrolase lipase domain-containing protein n=1 Tax=Orchesella dallaii TaxID=48710 RepID=A0ABP1RBY6_9HEXA